MNPIDKYLIQIYELFEKSSTDFIELQKKEKFVFFNLYGTQHMAFFDNELINQILTSGAESFVKGRGFNVNGVIKTLGLKKIFGDGLITSEGKKHLENKRIIQPLFNKTNTEQYIPKIIDVVNEELKRVGSSEKVDLHNFIKGITLKSASDCLLGENLFYEASAIEESLTKLMSHQKISQDNPSKKEIVEDFLSMINQREYLYKANKAVLELIQKKKKEKVKSHDLLSVLIEHNFNDKELSDHIFTMLLSSYETTCALVFWSMFYLNKNKEMLERLKEEANKTEWIEQKKIPTTEELSNSPICNNIIKETLRMYPSVWFILRQTVEEIKVGEVVIPKDMYLVIPLYTIHRNEKYFENPEFWNPDRWTKDFESTLPRCSYIPFSHGTRKCVGDNFGIVEAQIILLLFAKNLNWFGDQLQDPGGASFLTIKPKNKVYMTIEKREKDES